MSLKDKLRQAENSEHAQKTSNWFKFKEGDNNIRILTDPVIFFEDFKLGICYTDCGYQGTMKGLAWIWDKSDNQIKLMKLNYGLLNTLEAWEDDEDYGFDSYPMPYGINIKAKGAGSKEVEYNYLPRPKTDIPSEVTEKLQKEKSCEEIIEKMKEKNIEKHKADGTFDKIKSEQEQIGKEIEQAKQQRAEQPDNYPDEEIDPDDIPF